MYFVYFIIFVEQISYWRQRIGESSTPLTFSSILFLKIKLSHISIILNYDVWLGPRQEAFFFYLSEGNTVVEKHLRFY